jgi:hypothetical protein
LFVLDVILGIINTGCDLIEWLTGQAFFSLHSDVIQDKLTTRHKKYLEDRIIGGAFKAFASGSEKSGFTPCECKMMLEYLFQLFGFRL